MAGDTACAQDGVLLGESHLSEPPRVGDQKRSIPRLGDLHLWMEPQREGKGPSGRHLRWTDSPTGSRSREVPRSLLRQSATSSWTPQALRPERCPRCALNCVPNRDRTSPEKTSPLIIPCLYLPALGRGLCLRPLDSGVGDRYQRVHSSSATGRFGCSRRDWPRSSALTSE